LPEDEEGKKEVGKGDEGEEVMRAGREGSVWVSSAERNEGRAGRKVHDQVDLWPSVFVERAPIDANQLPTIGKRFPKRKGLASNGISHGSFQDSELRYGTLGQHVSTMKGLPCYTDNTRFHH